MATLCLTVGEAQRNLRHTPYTQAEPRRGEIIRFINNAAIAWLSVRFISDP